MSILIVGAGFAGAVYARTLAEAGYKVQVIDRRPHIGGNCFDYVHESGVRVHQYGPHLFHTSNNRVVEWLSRFTEWTPYEHKVVAKLPDGRLLPLPVNLDTVNGIFGLELDTPEQVAAQLRSVSVRREPIANAEDWLYANIGPDLTNLFFRPYTKKMWDLDLTEMEADVVKRIQVRIDRDNRYFPTDTFQAMPTHGYTAIFERIFDHPNIKVRLNETFDKKMLLEFAHCFNSMPIDEFFDFELGELPYRSIRFHLHEHQIDASGGNVTVNYTDAGPHTRETWWHNIPDHHEVKTGVVLATVEEPCDYRDNNFERYYPIKMSDGRYDKLYSQYKARADSLGGLTFIGRCGTYQYLDMHQAINQSMQGVRKWLDVRSEVAPAEAAAVQ